MSYGAGTPSADPNAGLVTARAKLAALANKSGPLSADEQAEYDRLQAYVLGVPQSASSSSSSSNTKDIFAGQKGLLDATNAFTEKQMGLSNRYRTIEGATQGQIDEAMNRRILTDGNVKTGLQDNSARLTEIAKRSESQLSEDAKRRDAQRAVMNFRSDGRSTT